MTKLRFNPFLEKISGKYGDVVFRRWHDRIVISHAPDMEGVEPSPAQLAQRERFRQAALYAKRTFIDPIAVQPYRLAAEHSDKPLFALIARDFLVAPVIASLDLADYTGKLGDPIVIRAHDDFELTAVGVRLTNAAGATLENGAAEEEPPGTGRWVYSAQTTQAAGTRLTITAVAVDRPGNKTEKTADKTI